MRSDKHTAPCVLGAEIWGRDFTLTVKLRIRLGAVEIEYEGSEDFLKAELQTILSKVSTLQESVGNPTPMTVPENGATNGAATPTNEGANPPLQMTTNNIATKLGAKTGAALVIAACAHLALVKGKEKFSRKEISEEIQTATSYYKQNHLKNLSQSLQSLVSGDKLNEPARETYALTHQEKTRIESILANK